MLFDGCGGMNDHTLSVYIENYIAAAGHSVYFTWQGGEPTLAGLDFFRRVTELQQKYRGGKRIYNALQTNGILLNDAWCQFLKAHHFLVGISVDGPEVLHDRYRRTRSGKGTFTRVMRAIDLLKQYQIEFNTLTVVNSVNARYPGEVYAFLKSVGSRHMQFIELLETSEPNIYPGTTPSSSFIVKDFSVSPVDYGAFMSSVFQEWVRADVGTVFIRQFESLISCFLGNGHTSCVFQASCRNNFILEANGDIYECDQFVYPQYKTGNIHESDIRLMESRQLTALKTELCRECTQCIYLPVCNGGCPKHRIHKVCGGTKSYFCKGYKIFFNTTTPYMNAFVELARQGISLVHIMDIAEQISRIARRG